MTEEQLHRWADAFFIDHLGLAPRKTFGCPAYYAGRKLFAFVYKGMLGIKDDPERVAEAVKGNTERYRHFNPGDGIMKNWLLLSCLSETEYDEEIPRIMEAFSAFRT